MMVNEKKNENNRNVSVVFVTPKRNGITKKISAKYEHFTGVIVKVTVLR